MASIQYWKNTSTYIKKIRIYNFIIILWNTQVIYVVTDDLYFNFLFVSKSYFSYITCNFLFFLILHRSCISYAILVNYFYLHYSQDFEMELHHLLKEWSLLMIELSICNFRYLSSNPSLPINKKDYVFLLDIIQVVWFEN